MKTFKPSDIFTFGKYKGEKLDFVFTFHPEYIEWLILNSDSFAIDIDAFKTIHTCPFAEEYCIESKYFNSISVSVNGQYRNCSLREYLTEFMDLYENHYLNPPKDKRFHKFSEKIIAKNELKAKVSTKRSREHNEERPQSYEDWLREEFDDDAGIAYWNTH